jgi:hypothetical protein
MKPLRATLSAILVLALAVNPLLAAALLPCCCAGKEADSQCPVCQAAETPVKSAQPTEPATAAESDCCQSCCHKSCCETDSDTPAVPAESSIDAADCNCVKSLPPSTLVRDKTAPPAVEQLWLLALAPSSIDPVIPAVRHFILTDEIRTPTGPPLLALYCTWLK